MIYIIIFQMEMVIYIDVIENIKNEDPKVNVIFKPMNFF